MKKQYLIILLIFLISCDMYKSDDIIEIVGNRLNEKEQLYVEVSKIINEFDIDTCSMYGVMTSLSTDAFSLTEYYYDINKNELVDKRDIKVNYEKAQAVNRLCKENKTIDIFFVKDIYTSFAMFRCRDKEKRVAELIYFKDKEIFKKLFPDRIYYENVDASEVDEQKKWVYFYNDHWAVTTRSTYFKKTTCECKAIIR